MPGRGAGRGIAPVCVMARGGRLSCVAAAFGAGRDGGDCAQLGPLAGVGGWCGAVPAGVGGECGEGR